MSHAHSAIDSLIANLTLQRYQKGGQVTKQPINEIVSEIYSEMPILKQHDFVVKGVDKSSEYGGSIEFMSPREPANPYGKPYVELYENAPTDRKELKRAIWGDMLHHLSDVDPHWKELRSQYMQARPKEQVEFDKWKYADLVERGQEIRSFDEWMDRSWADASIREPLKGNKKWLFDERGLPLQTNEQFGILKTMMQYLESKNNKK